MVVVQVAAILALAVVAVRCVGGPILRTGGVLLMFAGLLGLALGQSTTGGLIVVAAGAVAWDRRRAPPKEDDASPSGQLRAALTSSAPRV